MFHVVLMEPEIPPNTGNVARTCAATASMLHLIKPLGFNVDDRTLKRAGLDYWHFLSAEDAGQKDDRYALTRYGHIHENVDEVLREAEKSGARIWYATTKAPRMYTEVEYRPGDYLMFGPETRGLPETLLQAHPERCVRIPMQEAARSLNLSNSVAILLFEALRQNDFAGLSGQGKMAGAIPESN